MTKAGLAEHVPKELKHASLREDFPLADSTHQSASLLELVS